MNKNNIINLKNKYYFIDEKKNIYRLSNNYSKIKLFGIKEDKDNAYELFIQGINNINRDAGLIQIIEAIRLDPSNYFYVYILAINSNGIKLPFYFNGKDKDVCCHFKKELLAKVIELNPTFPDGYLVLSNLMIDEVETISGKTFNKTELKNEYNNLTKGDDDFSGVEISNDDL